MSRKETITIRIILDTAFAMAREEGFSQVTARKVATKVGCSTQPIFRVYQNMDELQQAVYEEAVKHFQAYYAAFTRISGTPFVNLGMAYIAYAREEKHLFQLLFANEKIAGKGMYELLNGSAGNVVKEINLAKRIGCKDAGSMFMQMWIFIHGAACMTLTGDYDLNDQETLQLLEKSYHSFSKAQ